MDTRVHKRTPTRSARKRVAAQRAPAGAVTGSCNGVVGMAETEVVARNAERRTLIARAAYYRAQTRGFEPGHELEDWLAAEAEVARS